MKKEVEAVYRDKQVVQSYAIDMKGRIFPYFLFTYMMNGAWNAVKHSSFDYKTLQMRGQFWALSKFFMEIDEFPGWDDTIEVETWGTCIDRFIAFREFCILSEKKEKLATGISSWLILDRETNRPQRLEPVEDEFNFIPDRGILSHKLEKIESLNNPKPLLAIPVKYSDIDVNQHVTAARYLQWMLDGYAPEFHQTRKLRSLEINFLAEAKMADEIIVMTETAAQPLDSSLHSIVRQQDNKELCRALLFWATL